MKQTEPQFNLSIILNFLSKLEKNNNKQWFDKNRYEYQACRAEWIKVVEYLLKELGESDPDFWQQDPRKSIFRINRDIRFSRSKLPYKSHFSAFLCHGGKKANNAGYYIHIAPAGCFIAGGIYSPDKDRLFALREKISKHGDKFVALINKKKFKTAFGTLGDTDRLVRPPQGFKKENPYIEIIKNKHFIVRENIPQTVVLNPDFMKMVRQRFELMEDFVDFLNRV